MITSGGMYNNSLFLTLRYVCDELDERVTSRISQSSCEFSTTSSFYLMWGLINPYFEYCYTRLTSNSSDVVISMAALAYFITDQSKCCSNYLKNRVRSIYIILTCGTRTSVCIENNLFKWSERRTFNFISSYFTSV